MRKPSAFFVMLFALMVSARASSIPQQQSTPALSARSEVGTLTATDAASPTAIGTPSPTNSPIADAPLPTSTLTSPDEITGGPSSTDGPIEIVGDPDFVHQTQLALSLLQTKAPDAFQKAEAFVAIIEQADHSGMWAYEQLPRYAVSDQTAFYSVTWYASTIAHDSTHSELYHEYLELNGAPVPDDVWTGVAVERFCNAYQLDVLRRIGGPADEVDYLANQTGTHCDLDGDGDCDWDDYNSRDW